MYLLKGDREEEPPSIDILQSTRSFMPAFVHWPAMALGFIVRRYLRAFWESLKDYFLVIVAVAVVSLYAEVTEEQIVDFFITYHYLISAVMIVYSLVIRPVFRTKTIEGEQTDKE